MSSKEKNPLHGRTWDNGRTYDTYDLAVSQKEKLESEVKNLSVKIRRTAENRFLIKTRSTVVPKSNDKTAAKKSTSKTRSQRKKEKAAKHKARQENH